MLGDQDEEVREYEHYVEDLEDLGRLHSKVIDLGRLRGSLWVFTEKRSLSRDKFRNSFSLYANFLILSCLDLETESLRSRSFLSGVARSPRENFPSIRDRLPIYGYCSSERIGINYIRCC